MAFDTRAFDERDLKMTCEEAVKKLHEYIDHELDQVSAEQVERHFELCRMCCDQMEFEKSMKKLIHEYCSGKRAPLFLREKIQDCLGSQE
jgi:anti-sigma factor (TIGR02949 family)